MRKAVYAFFLFNLFVILFFWFGNFGGNIFLVLGRLAGLLLVLCVLVQFSIMSRARWLERAFGLDELAKIHHLNGYFTSVFLILHPVLLTIGYSKFTGFNLWQQFLDLVNNFQNVNLALIGALILLFIICLSVYVHALRAKIKYEIWYYVHLFTYVAIALAWFHQLEIGEDFLGSLIFTCYWYALYIFVFGNLLIFRVLRPIYNLGLHKFYVEKLKKENGNATSIYIKGIDMKNFKIKAGKFVMLRFLAKNYFLESHPFSVSRIGDNYFTVTPKAVGDFTSTIPNLPKNIKVIVDGPYGSFTTDFAVHKKFLFIAGGIGITPIRAMIGEIKNTYQMALIYSATTSSEFTFKKELDSLSKKYDFPISYHESESGGHLNGQKISEIIKDLKSRDIYICGPVAMMDSLNRDLLAMGLKSSQIHFEKFSL